MDPDTSAVVRLLILSGCGSGPRKVVPAAHPNQHVISAKPTLLVYGDSLTVLSESATRQRYNSKFKLVFRAVGGSGICDWLGEAATDRERYRPARVVTAFTGNVFNCSRTDFLHERLTGLVGNYERSLRVLARTFEGTPIKVIAPPAMTTVNGPQRGWYPCNGNPALLAMYERVSAELGLDYSTVADESLTTGHVYTDYRPAFGTKGPMTRVRALDGIHLTPAGEVYYAVALAG